MKKIIAKNLFLGLISGLAFGGILLLLMLITQPVSSSLVVIVLGCGLIFGLAMSVYFVISAIRGERTMDKGQAYLENLDETFPPCKMKFQGSLQYKPGVECPMRIWFFEDHFVVVYLRSRKASVFEFAYADVSDAYVVHDAFSFVCKGAHFSVVLDASDSELEALHRFTVDCGIGPKGCYYSKGTFFCKKGEIPEAVACVLSYRAKTQEIVEELSEEVLLIHFVDQDAFDEAYRDCFSVDGIEFDARDDISYTKDQTEQILAKVKELRPVGCDDLIPWLERAVAEYDGIGFDGV